MPQGSASYAEAVARHSPRNGAEATGSEPRRGVAEPPPFLPSRESLHHLPPARPPSRRDAGGMTQPEQQVRSPRSALPPGLAGNIGCAGAHDPEGCSSGEGAGGGDRVARWSPRQAVCNLGRGSGVTTACHVGCRAHQQRAHRRGGWCNTQRPQSAVEQQPGSPVATRRGFLASRSSWSTTCRRADARVP